MLGRETLWPRACVACKLTPSTHSTFNQGLTFPACIDTADNAALAGLASLQAQRQGLSGPGPLQVGAVYGSSTSFV